MEADIEQTPHIIKVLRSGNFGLNCQIYEYSIEPEDVHYLDQQELRQLRHRTDREELLDEIAKLIS